MSIGWAINSAMILLAAATFFVHGVSVSELQQAQELLVPLLGENAAHIFAIALLFAGIASTTTRVWQVLLFFQVCSVNLTI